MHNLLIEDCFFDGCYVGFSARGYVGQPNGPFNGLSNTVTINNTLVRLQPFMEVYSGSAPGHGGFFKWPNPNNHAEHGYGPMLSIHDSVFLVTQAENHADHYLGTPYYKDPTTQVLTSALASSSNNLIIWTGSGAFPETVPSGFTLSTDIQDWYDAIEARGWNPPVTSGATQTVNVLARKGSNAGTPTIALNLYENGVFVRNLVGATNITSTTGQVVSGTFNSSEITNPDDVEVQVVMTAVATNSAQIAYIEWVAEIGNAAATVPAAITNLSGTAGEGLVSLTWTAPNDGGAAITDYIVQYKVG
jgi:hypothetical protein